MRIQFKKGDAKPSTLTCIREDSTITWTTLRNNFESHDLAHYAVETVLGFDRAFYGLLSQGFNIQDFELPRGQRPEALIPANLPEQSLQTEHLVNLLLTPGISERNDFDLIGTLRQILEADGLGFPHALNPISLEKIYNTYDDLTLRWQALAAGGILELSFNTGA
ncbi:hypothetical protein [Flagellimonas flava]|uniref:Uncharacterized protein n=1 Tax=Flagellimonas flava TaxID=570519 RepID=A0A1M5KN63_9FLAO|nr:hypothetical protein [Allomuricauda flava]SHG54201.1 hypothetical protein SAMN04488116_1682 [Allomuricauda flava]